MIYVIYIDDTAAYIAMIHCN